MTVLGPEAQVTRVTGDSLSVQVDLSNFQDRTGTVEVPATVALTGNLADSCWVGGDYTVSVTFSQGSVSAASASAREGVAATPQE